MWTRIVVITPDSAEDDPLGVLKILEDHTAYTFPLERGMEALLGGVLIAGMADGSERLDYGALARRAHEGPGALLRSLVGVDDYTDRIGAFPERILQSVAAEPGRHGIRHPHSNDPAGELVYNRG